MEFAKKFRAVEHSNVNGGIVIQLCGKFYVYKTPEELDSKADELKGRYHCLEIVKRNKMRKPFIDIDAKLADTELMTVCEKLTELFGGNDYQIYQTGRGHHIVINDRFISYVEHAAKLEIAKRDICSFVDAGVLHSLRLPSTRKPNAPCKSVQVGAKLSEMLVQPFDAPNDDENGNVVDKAKFDGEITNDFEKLLSSTISDNEGTFKYRDNNSIGFNFDRIQSAYCKICDTIHDRDNAFMVYIGGNAYRAYCSRNLGKYLPINAEGLPEYSKGYPGAFEKCSAELYESAPLHLGGIGCIAPSEGNYIDASPCGVGKTTALYANIHPNANVLLISYRRTFTAKMATDFNLTPMPASGVIEFRKGTGMRLVCQIDSLHRVSVPSSESVDVLILDELHGLNRQLFGDLSNIKIRDSISRFDAIIKLAKRVVVLDAQANDNDRNIMEKATGKPFSLIKNTFKPNQGKKLYSLESFEALEATMLKYIKEKPAGEKFIIFTHTKDAKMHSVEYFARTMQQIGLKVKYYHSGIDQVKRDQDFRNADEVFGGVDCVIYNSTLEAGVSIRNTAFKRLFCFSSMLGATEVTFQAIHRFRAIENIYYASRSLFGQQKYPTNKAAVENAYKRYLSGCLNSEEKSRLFGDLVQTNAPITMSELDSWIGQSWLYTVLENYRSKSHFNNRLFKYLEESGYEIVEMTLDDKKKVVMPLVAECDDFLKQTPAERIYNAKVITDEKANEMLEKATNKTQEMMLSIDRALLVQRLDIDEANFKLEDVENFKSLVSQWYRYKTLISNYEINEDSKKLSSNASLKEAHKRTNTLISTLGFGDLNGEVKTVSGKDYYKAVDSNKQIIEDFNKDFGYLFGGFGMFKLPKMTEVNPRATTGMICKALELLYGLTFESSDKRNAIRGIYSITPQQWPSKQLANIKQDFNAQKKKMLFDMGEKKKTNPSEFDISDIYEDNTPQVSDDDIYAFLESLE
jgi:hypothetical protein